MADWTKIKAEYIRGGTSYLKLAEKYGVSESTVVRHAKREKWLERRKEKECKVTSKIADAAAEHESNVAKALYSTTELLLKRIAEAMNEAPGMTPSDAANWANALERVKRTAGIKDKPDAEEQQARIDKLHKEAQTGTDETAEGKVIVIPARVITEGE